MLLVGTCSVDSLYHCLAEMDFPVVLQLQETISLLNITEVPLYKSCRKTCCLSRIMKKSVFLAFEQVQHKP